MAENENRNSLEALEARKKNAEQRILDYESRKKRLEEKNRQLNRQINDLKRKERTHRLCKHGGMLEGFLPCPEAIDDEELMTLLTLAFRQPTVENMLKHMKSQAAQTLHPGDLIPADMPHDGTTHDKMNSQEDK